MSSFPKGKVIAITGGASGIGQATALAFAREGTNVVIEDLDGAGGEKTVADIKQKGGEARFVRMDVTQSADIQRLVAEAVKQYGGLDYLLMEIRNWTNPAPQIRNPKSEIGPSPI